MQICPTHWSALRQAITDRGLSHLVMRSREDAADSIRRQLAGEATAADFDPLMNANWEISAQYLKGAGLAGLVGELCPLCDIDQGRPGLAADWIDGCSDDQLTYARSLGLVAQIQ